MVTRELIERFFRDECTDDEKSQILDYFKSNPEEFGKYLDENEWNQFNAKEELNPVVSKALFDKVREKTFQKRRLSKVIYRLSVAAAIIIIVGVGWISLRSKSSGLTDTKDDHSLASRTRLVEKLNTSDRSAIIALEDGSTIELAPNSRVMYYEPFVVNNRRDIQLIGEASFRVAKDHTKPFTVFADGIATTALGTYFTVRAFDSSDALTVALHEGKVVVKSSDTSHKKLKKDFFLFPGDEFIYNKSTLLASIRHESVGEHQLVSASTKQERSNSVKKPDWYQYNSAALSEVLNQLSTYYQVEIYYYPEEIKNKFYSGRIEKTDSLENILKDIALLNRFTLAKKDGVYIIRKGIK